MKIAYFDLSSGVAGDMILAALLDAGLNYEQLISGLKSLPLDGYEIKIEKVKRSSISATHFDVLLLADKKHLHGKHTHEHKSEHFQSNVHKHLHDLAHDHGHDHSHSHDHSHEDPHRNLSDITKIINASKLPEKVKADSLRVFFRLGEAEAKVHGVSIDQIHFHEVGAIDSIIDIVGGCLGLHLLGIEKVLFSPFYFGTGQVKCAHGMMPVPAPATVNLSLGFQSIQTKVKGELTTPTGAAMMTALGTQINENPCWKPTSIGYGAGTRIQTEVLGALRVTIGEQLESTSKVLSRNILQVEFNVDDMTPEQVSFLTDKLRQCSKQDVWLESIYMKKNRMATKVCLLSEIQDLEEIQAIIFKESSSFGFRYTQMSKVEFAREFETVSLNGTAIRIKHSLFNGQKKSAPEYEDCRQYAETSGMPIQQVFIEALKLSKL